MEVLYCIHAEQLTFQLLCINMLIHMQNVCRLANRNCVCKQFFPPLYLSHVSSQQLVIWWFGTSNWSMLGSTCAWWTRTWRASRRRRFWSSKVSWMSHALPQLLQMPMNYDPAKQTNSIKQHHMEAGLLFCWLARSYVLVCGLGGVSLVLCNICRQAPLTEILYSLARSTVMKA